MSNVQFNKDTAYIPIGDVWCDDGREDALLQFIESHPNRDNFPGNPENILKAIDEFAHAKQFMMNVGPYKGKIVSEQIAETRPGIFVELGGYCGYSALLFGSVLRKSGGQKYYSLEIKPNFAAVSRKLLTLAGLDDLVTIIVGPAADGLKALKEENQVDKIDMLFLDHYKPFYGPDLRVAEELGLVQEGTVLAADNVIYPGNPEYLALVRPSDEHQRPWQYVSRLEQSFEPTGDVDGVEISRCVKAPPI